jgi:ketosteroid isomerase-like protein
MTRDYDPGDTISFCRHEESGGGLVGCRLASLALVTFTTFDLGGTVSGSKINALKHVLEQVGYSSVAAAKEFDGRLQASYRYSRPPILCLKTEDIELDFEARDLDFEAPKPFLAHLSLQVHPAGIISFRHDIPLPRDASVWSAIHLRDTFLRYSAVPYRPYLKEKLHPDPLQLQGLMVVPTSDGGLNMIEPVTRIRAVAREHLDLRERTYWPLSNRFAVVMADRPPDAESWTAMVQEFAATRGTLVQTTRGTLVPTQAEGSPSITLRTWDCVNIAACDDDALLMVVEPAERPGALQCVELAQDMWFLVRTWTDVLERRRPMVDIGRPYSEAKIRRLEGTMVASSTTEQQIAQSLIEVDSTTVMFSTPWQAQLVEACNHIFCVPLFRRLASERLSAIHRHHGIVAQVVQQAYGQSARKQGDRLQILFAGAVAAQIAAVVIAIWALVGQNGFASRTALPIIVAGVVLVALWGAAGVYILRRRISVTVGNLGEGRVEKTVENDLGARAPMREENNLDAVRRSVTAWNMGELAPVLQDMKRRVVWRTHGMPGPHFYLGHKGVRRFFIDLHRAWEDYWIVPEVIVPAGDDTVVMVGRVGGKERESGNQIDTAIVNVYKFRDGKCVRGVTYLGR